MYGRLLVSRSLDVYNISSSETEVTHWEDEI